jgi:Flp pilus assembly protein TadD
MEQGRKKLSFDLSLILVLMFLGAVVSCTLPRIIVLDDTLTAEQHNDLGYVYETKGLTDLAEKEYTLASKKRDEWYVPWFNKGNLFFKKGDYRLAEEHLREALQRSGDNADVMNNLANALLEQGHRQEAQQLIEKSLHIEKKEEYFDTLRSIQQRDIVNTK